MTLRKAKWIAIMVAVVWVVVGVPWSYYDWPIPESKIVKILGTRDKKIGNTDQRRVQTYIVKKDCTIDRTAPYVLANDDSWAWLKKNSEDLQAQATAMAIETVGMEEAPYVKIGHNLWRFKWLDMFPNLLSLKELEGCPYEDRS